MELWLPDLEFGVVLNLEADKEIKELEEDYKRKCEALIFDSYKEYESKHEELEKEAMDARAKLIAKKEKL